jgi:hypothetical protein
MDVFKNEVHLSKGLKKMPQHVTECNGEVKKFFTIKRIFTVISMLLAVNDHSIQL